MTHQDPDLVFTDHASLWMLNAWTEAGQQWINHNVDYQGAVSWAGGIPIEHRMVRDIIDGAMTDDMVVRVHGARRAS